MNLNNKRSTLDRQREEPDTSVDKLQKHIDNEMKKNL